MLLGREGFCGRVGKEGREVEEVDTMWEGRARQLVICWESKSMGDRR